MGIYRKQRWLQIMDLLAQQGRVQVGDIAKHLDLSLVTIRHDLDEMHEQGLLTRTHGGAVANSSAAMNHDQAKEAEPETGEISLIKKIITDIDEDDYVFLDGGGLSKNFTQYLIANKPMLDYTIFTNSISVANSVLDSCDITVKLLGGEIDRKAKITGGESAVSCFGSTKMAIAIINPDRISPDGIFMNNIGHAKLYKHVVTHSTTMYMLIDQLTFGKTNGDCIFSLPADQSIKEKLHILSLTEIAEANKVREKGYTITTVQHFLNGNTTAPIHDE